MKNDSLLLQNIGQCCHLQTDAMSLVTCNIWLQPGAEWERECRVGGVYPKE